MVKASLWMHKDEFKKITELSGDLSLNLFVMRAVRKAIAAAEEMEEKKNKKNGLQGSLAIQGGEEPATATTVDIGGSSKSNEDQIRRENKGC